MEIFTLILSILSFTGIIILLLRKNNPNDIQQAMLSFSNMISNNQKEIGNMQTERFALIDKRIYEMNSTLEKELDRMRKENSEKLTEIRRTVDEKLQETLESRISKSFRIVNERLEQVYKGLGEMQSLAQGVGDLKKVLSNVKTRGILGEMQLGAILEEIMSPEQYEANIATVANSKNVVEFAIKLPDRDGGYTYLPIDSKFPADTYTALLDAYESGDKTAVDLAAKALRQRILSEAKDIRTKYVSPPSTTDFAIMFLPFEGLYAEAVNRGLVEELQNTYRIMIAGPSTMAAMLNSIQMGFKTLAIEKRSAEVWNVLGAVKTEFEKFGDILTATQKRLNQANDELDKLVGVRTRAIVRKLNSVEKLNTDEDLFLDE